MQTFHTIFKLIIVSLGLLITVEANQEIRDPFMRNYQIPCDEQEQSLLASIKAWQLKGVMITATNLCQIWLFSDPRWVIINVRLTNLTSDDPPFEQLSYQQLSYEELPHVLHPWQIVAISTESVIFRADLSPMCKQSLSWTVALLPNEEARWQ